MIEYRRNLSPDAAGMKDKRNAEDLTLKSIGIVRKIDELGRIVLPIETRRQLELEPRDGVEIFVDEDMVILKKYQPCCIFCGDGSDISMFRGKKVCRKCIAELTEK